VCRRDTVRCVVMTLWGVLSWHCEVCCHDTVRCVVMTLWGVSTWHCEVCRHDDTVRCVVVTLWGVLSCRCWSQYRSSETETPALLTTSMSCLMTWKPLATVTLTWIPSVSDQLQNQNSGATVALSKCLCFRQLGRPNWMLMLEFLNWISNCRCTYAVKISPKIVRHVVKLLR